MVRARGVEAAQSIAAAQGSGQSPQRGDGVGLECLDGASLGGESKKAKNISGAWMEGGRVLLGS